jgi:6-phosphogluconolactonase (cycloisomerase 2 family)
MLTPGRNAAGGFAFLLLTACGGGSGEFNAGGGQGPTGYVYVTSTMPQSSGVVYQYGIGTNGSLTPLSTASVPSGLRPTAIVSDPNGHYVYVVNEGDATISQYSVGAGGALTALSPATVSTAGPSADITSYTASIDPSGRFLYVVGLSFVPAPSAPPTTPAVILQFSIGNNGTLTPLSPSSISVPTPALAPLAIDPGGRYAYLATTSTASRSQVLQFSISNDGSLAAVASPLVTAAANAIGVTIAPDGRTAYVLSACIDTNCDGQVTVYAVGMNGALTPTVTTTATGSHIIPITLLADTSGSNAYLLANQMGVDTNQGTIYQYTISSAGALAPDSPASLGVDSGAVAESVAGPFLYALSANAVGFASGNQTGGHVNHYAIGSGGVLTAVGSETVAAGLPTAMTIVAAH